jgi:hypothetical protein
MDKVIEKNEMMHNYAKCRIESSMGFRGGVLLLNQVQENFDKRDKKSIDNLPA